MKKTLQLFTTLILTSLFFTFPTHSADTKAISNSSEKAISVININTADVKALMQLKGVGTKKAKAIINYRKLNGKFTSLSGLLKIRGIGEKFLKENKQRLSI